MKRFKAPNMVAISVENNGRLLLNLVQVNNLVDKSKLDCTRTSVRTWNGFYGSRR